MSCIRKSISFSLYLLSILLILLLFPIFIVILVPIYIFRSIASFYSDHFIPSHGSILNPISSLLASDDFTNPGTSVLVNVILAGEISHKKIEERLQEILPKYRELTQKLAKWMGFFIWVEDPTFSLDNHFILKDQEEYNRKSLTSLAETLINKPFRRDRPLWDVTIIKKYRDDRNHPKKNRYPLRAMGVPNPSEDCKTCSAIILRFHHALADGYSMYSLLTEFSDNEPLQVLPSFPKRNFFGTIGFVMKLVFWAPVETLYSLLQSMDRNILKLDERKFAGQAWNAYRHDEVLVDDIKRIAKEQKVCFLAVVFALVAGGLRRFVNKEYGRNRVMPEVVHFMVPFPLPGRPSNMTNFMSMIPFPLPLGVADPLERIQLIQKTIEVYKSSVIPYGLFGFAWLFGSLPTWFLGTFVRNVFGTGILTCFPGPRNQLQFCGQQVIHVSTLGGIPKGTVGLGFSCQTYNGTANLTAIAEKGLFPTQDLVESWIKYFVQEMDSFNTFEQIDHIV